MRRPPAAPRRRSSALVWVLRASPASRGPRRSKRRWAASRSRWARRASPASPTRAAGAPSPAATRSGPPRRTRPSARVVELRVAPSFTDCPRATASVRLVATAAWPTFDLSFITLALDEGRLEARGHGLHGVLVTWPVDAGRASDTCRDLKADGGVETCTWGVPKTLPADPSASALCGGSPPARSSDPTRRSTTPTGRDRGARGLRHRAEPRRGARPPAGRRLGRRLLRRGARAPHAPRGGRRASTAAPSRCSIDSGQLVMQAPPAVGRHRRREVPARAARLLHAQESARPAARAARLDPPLPHDRRLRGRAPRRRQRARASCASRARACATSRRSASSWAAARPT